ncbi:hypothetical protein CAPTEDRAFT_208690 [Capitella teleta]|uniref:Uncharacterized protein n=1 Tax=Capitella teleta TaxID=283909 RepID=R7TNI1_CAPTE|nr:hypothetical protein CAPTEDRAFT_208690 [Capitella teleta]|eukprot:ELT95413.1 hypothetical protein CAPTEDRAFT_208690 [Capitella teleta]
MSSNKRLAVALHAGNSSTMSRSRITWLIRRRPIRRQQSQDSQAPSRTSYYQGLAMVIAGLPIAVYTLVSILKSRRAGGHPSYMVYFLCLSAFVLVGFGCARFMYIMNKKKRRRRIIQRSPSLHTESIPAAPANVMIVNVEAPPSYTELNQQITSNVVAGNPPPYELYMLFPKSSAV